MEYINKNVNTSDLHTHTHQRLLRQDFADRRPVLAHTGRSREVSSSSALHLCATPWCVRAPAGGGEWLSYRRCGLYPLKSLHLAKPLEPPWKDYGRVSSKTPSANLEVRARTRWMPPRGVGQVCGHTGWDTGSERSASCPQNNSGASDFLLANGQKRFGSALIFLDWWKLFSSDEKQNQKK